ncbi:hypothetical protein Ddye_026593 [Dipteronia dyeriana]|uniref:Uncharacterized protein n=1 Tax=Dipteronia dyeriana TaxID=168575 RepID=A0AAD9TN98_9ROSI|nr:hypothetical protein Ddye_026593 [Dipteronia dyeriana]
MVAAAINPVWLTLPCQGFGGQTPGLQFHWGNKEMVQTRCTRKARPATISVLFELKPPPYPPLDGISLEDDRHAYLVSYNGGDILPPFNNAAQAWNHGFFWESMKPGGGGKPSGDLLELTERDFGSFETFLSEF